MDQIELKNGDAAARRQSTVIIGWDDVFGLHLQVWGDAEEARRVAEVLDDLDIPARADAEGTGRLGREGCSRVMLCEPARDPDLELDLREQLSALGYAVEPAEGVESVPGPYGERLRPLLDRGVYYDDGKRLTAVELGLTAEADGEELLRLAADPEFDHSWLTNAVWAPVWACVLLGELKPPGTSRVLLGLLERLDREDGDEALGEILPEVFGRIGRELIPDLSAVVCDEARGLPSRWAAVSGLEKIAGEGPEARAEIVAKLTAMLEARAVRDETVNGTIIDALINLRAVEAAGVIERTFQAGGVDEVITGDWDEVQVALGLKEPPRPVSGLSAYGAEPVRRETPKVGRNDPCPCGSGKKFKKCCGG